MEIAGVNIRQITLADKDKFLFCEMFEKYYKEIKPISCLEPKDPSKAAEQVWRIVISPCILNKVGSLLFLEVGGHVKGMLYWTPVMTAFQTRHISATGGVFIKASCRGKGYSKALRAAGAKELVQQGFSHITGTVAGNNKHGEFTLPPTMIKTGATYQCALKQLV